MTHPDLLLPCPVLVYFLMPKKTLKQMKQKPSIIINKKKHNMYLAKNNENVIYALS